MGKNFVRKLIGFTSNGMSHLLCNKTNYVNLLYKKIQQNGNSKNNLISKVVHSSLIKSNGRFMLFSWFHTGKNFKLIASKRLNIFNIIPPLISKYVQIDIHQPSLFFYMFALPGNNGYSCRGLVPNGISAKPCYFLLHLNKSIFSCRFFASFWKIYRHFFSPH